MAKVQIKSEKITPFGGKFHVREHFSRYRLNTWSEMQQCHRIPVQRDCTFVDERVLLWRLMRGGCDITSDASSLVSSYLAHMQL